MSTKYRGIIRRKVTDLSKTTTIDDLETWARCFRHPIAIKLGDKLELFTEEMIV